MKKFGISFIVVPLLVLLFNGCANTGVVPLNKNSYYISEVDGSPGIHPPSADIIASVFGKANLFCSDKGMQMEKTNQTFTPSAFGRLASVSLEFKCINKR